MTGTDKTPRSTSKSADIEEVRVDYRQAERDAEHTFRVYKRTQSSTLRRIEGISQQKDKPVAEVA